MPAKISYETQKLIEILNTKGLSIPEIAQESGASYGTVYCYTRALERGFKSRKDYLLWLLGKKGFNSFSEYQTSLIQQRNLESVSTRTEYNKYLRHKNRKPRMRNYVAAGFDSEKDYQLHLLKERGFKSERDYAEFLARRKGYVSKAAYSKHLQEQHQEQPIYQKISWVITRFLIDHGKDQKWLAEQIGATRGAVSRYTTARARPGKQLEGKLIAVLGLQYKTLDELL
jgi:hypothetical protein